MKIRTAAIPNFALVLVLALTGVLVSAAHADTRFAGAQAHIETLLRQHKYQSAASYIADRKDLLAQPRFVRLYTHILTTQYAFTINFDIFALQDLKKGQRIEDIRGKKGQYQITGGPLDDLLYRRIKKNPNSPDLNYAVGEYLSRGSACGCRQGPLKDLSGDDSVYFLKAYRQGVADAWSLFRIGVHYQGRDELGKAIAFYRKSIVLDPENADTNYDLAFAYYENGHYMAATRYITPAVKNYRDAQLKSDAYNLQGMIFVAEGKRAAAEDSLKQALKVQSGNVDAFSNLLALYRHAGEHAKYVKCADDFIALDYGNTYPFNAYVDYLQQNGQTADDGEVEAHLLHLQLRSARQNGALYFNLARMADLRNNRVAALRRYRRSLAALKAQKHPPAGAIPAISKRIAVLEHPGKS